MNEHQHPTVDSKPKAIRLFPENIPQELKSLRQWVVWRYMNTDGKWTKPPFRTDGKGNASSTDPATWSDFAAALADYQTGSVDGIGIALTTDIGVVGVDVDHCHNSRTKSFAPWATTIIEHFNSYTEASPSGTGARIFLKGKLPGGGHKKGNIEIYSSGRYLTVTGRVLQRGVRTIEPRQAELDAFLAEHFPEPKKAEASANNNGHPHLADHQIIELALRAKNGDEVRSLLNGDWGGYPSQSEADMALCSRLAFYTQDATQIDRLYRGSKLFREKWNLKHYGDGATYGAGTIAKTISSTTETYSGKAEKDPNSIPSPKEGIGKATNWRPLSAAEILTLSTPLILWVWQGLIPKGSLFLLCAFMKVGKTTLAYRVALAIVQGLACLGRETTKTGVLILAVEEHIRDIRRRLERFGMT